MSQDARVYSMMIEHAVPMIEQTTDRAKLDHDLIVPITTHLTRNMAEHRSCGLRRMGMRGW